MSKLPNQTFVGIDRSKPGWDITNKGNKTLDNKDLLFGISTEIGAGTGSSSATFRILLKNGTFSPKVYSRGWKGGPVATYAWTPYRKAFDFAGNAYTTLSGGYKIYQGQGDFTTGVDVGFGSVGLMTNCKLL